ncbi:unnamed protein product [Parnassius apollo]|uniref:(apollo) hypothetical protein n=1 Tax=Parnassius apollo TaxID=110799 RepID=A0A8S3YCB2_PARAO|nr:unnamed protein product [Parnassius apollo]
MNLISYTVAYLPIISSWCFPGSITGKQTGWLLQFSLFLVFSSIYGQCLSRCANNFGVYDNGLAYNDCSLSAANAAAALAAANGGGFTVISSSPTAPYGVSVASDNEISGILSVIGQLPLLGTALFDGALPTAGTGFVRYGCGYGDVGIVNEDFTGTALIQGYGNGFSSEGFHDIWRQSRCGTRL